MFMDEEENMWVLRRNSNGKFRIKTGVEDDTALASFLEATCSVGGSGQATRLRRCLATPSVQGGDAINYVNVTKRFSASWLHRFKVQMTIVCSDAEDVQVIKSLSLTCTTLLSS